MRIPEAQSLFENRLEIHDRKQFELKLEYQPSGEDADTEYVVDTFLFLPASLNIEPETYPRSAFYSDIHNYVRLKTPIFSFDEILNGEHSPLYEIEQRTHLGLMGPESELVWDAKMLSCVFRGALRRFSRGMNERCAALAKGAEIEPAEKGAPLPLADLERLARTSVKGVKEVLARFRTAVTQLSAKYPLEEKTFASLRLVDEYLSLTVEQFFRKTIAEMDVMPKTGIYTDLRKELLAEILEEERYRKEHQLRSVVSASGDNEEYTHRIGFLKKFCMNVLFLDVRRGADRQNLEEVLLAAAAGLAMAFATGVAFFAQERFTQASFNFFLILVVGYMFKDRIKDGARRIFTSYAIRHLHDRSLHVIDPVTGEQLGLCREKVSYGRDAQVPPEISALRQVDDFTTAAQGELQETVIHYHKRIFLEADVLPRMGGGFVTGLTDIIRINVDRFLRDMDDPEFAMEYIDPEDFSVGHVKASKTYQVDVAFRFAVDDGDTKKATVELVRMVMDKNGIKRMLRVGTRAADPLKRGLAIWPVR